MKARDVVAGWPRGRSTSPPPDDRTWVVAWSLYQWPIEEVEKMLNEVEDDIRYHREQAEMMHEWHTKTGRFLPWWIGDPRFSLIVGFTEEA